MPELRGDVRPFSIVGIYKAPEKQRPDGAAGAFGTGDAGGRYSTGTVVALSLSVQDRIPTAVRPAPVPVPNSLVPYLDR